MPPSVEDRDDDPHEEDEAELPGTTRNADGHIIGITAGGWTNEQIAQVVVEAYLNARGMKS